VLVIDTAHEGGGGRENLIDEDKDCFLWAELDTLANNIDELTDGEICGDEVLLLIDSSNVRLLYLLADYLVRQSVLVTVLRERRAGMKPYRNAVGIFLANAFGFCLALLEGVFVLKLGTHDGYV